MPMRFDIVSLFPEFVAQLAAHGVVGRAGERGLLWAQSGLSKPYTAAVLDPEDDGQPDLYLGLEPPARRFAILPDLALAAPDALLRTAHASTEASNSDLEGLAVADLDGDGTRELVAAVSAWTSYGLRVYQPSAAGLQF